ncbi:MAG: UDP-N-acetyl glucosamine 2-epimerase, partial [bacterium]|nr:UDP-N-acetyl glucosamine 2-epimerase [bacterium]
MFDLALAARKLVDETDVLARWNLVKKEFILTTIHRPENTDQKSKLESICSALTELAKSGKTILFPLHPRTRKALDSHGLLKKKIPQHLILCDPVSYMEMVALESNARVIITDSGGVQKEGYFFDTPCVVAREQTEWVELMEAGWTILTAA